jgi:uncharacterized protein (DUF2164 family)
MVLIVHTSIAKTQVIISIEIHDFNKVIFVHGCIGVTFYNQGLNNFNQLI